MQSCYGKPVEERLVLSPLRGSQTGEGAHTHTDTHACTSSAQVQWFTKSTINSYSHCQNASMKKLQVRDTQFLLMWCASLVFMSSRLYIQLFSQMPVCLIFSS